MLRGGAVCGGLRGLCDGRAVGLVQGVSCINLNCSALFIEVRSLNVWIGCKGANNLSDPRRGIEWMQRTRRFWGALSHFCGGTVVWE